MSGNELTSEGTPHCCLFPKMKWNIILEQRTCRLELIATWLFCVTQEDPKACTWTLTLRLLCSIQPPSSPSVLPPATTDMASLPGPEAAALAAPLPGILESIGVISAETLPHHPPPHPTLFMLIRGTFHALVFLRAPAPVWYEAHAAPRQWFCLFQCV